MLFRSLSPDRLCMCYLAVCLRSAAGCGASSSRLVSFPGGSNNSSNCAFLSSCTSQSLLNHALDEAPNHFGHLGPQFESVLQDIRVLERAIELYSSRWDSICLSAKQLTGRGCTTLSWPTSRHDLVLYVAFAPNSLLYTFLHHTTLKPKEGMSLLVYAAYFNKDEHARTLLLQGTKVNCTG